MRAKAIGNCNCNASSRAHCACVCACMCAALHWYWGEWPCMTQIKVTALANKGDKWLLTHSLGHSLTHSLSHSLTRWRRRRRRHCAKTKLQQKAQRALKMRPSAMNSIQHTHTHTNTRTHTHTHTHTIMTGCRERGRERGRERRSEVLRRCVALQSNKLRRWCCNAKPSRNFTRVVELAPCVGHLTVPQNASGVGGDVGVAAIAAMLAVVRLHLELETSLLPRHWKSESTFFYCCCRCRCRQLCLCLCLCRCFVLSALCVRAAVCSGSCARVGARVRVCVRGIGARFSGKWTFWRFNLLVGASTSLRRLRRRCETSLLRWRCRCRCLCLGCCYCCSSCFSLQFHR